MGIELKDHATIYVGESSTRFFQMRVILHALKLELKGIKVRRGYNAHRAAKQMYHLTGTRQQVHDKLEEMVNAELAKQEIIDERTPKNPVHEGGSGTGG